MLFNSTNQTNFGWDLVENLDFEARSDEVGPSAIEGEAWTRNHIKFPFTNKMYKENHAADRVLKLQWVTSPRHLVFECAKLQRPHSESRLPTWPLTFTPLLALSLLYVQLKNIVSATTTQHISVKGVARFCVSGQVIKSFFAYGRILKTTLKGKVIQLYILWTLKLWWVEHFYMFNQMVFLAHFSLNPATIHTRPG